MKILLKQSCWDVKVNWPFRPSEAKFLMQTELLFSANGTFYLLLIYLPGTFVNIFPPFITTDNHRHTQAEMVGFFLLPTHQEAIPSDVCVCVSLQDAG